MHSSRQKTARRVWLPLLLFFLCYNANLRPIPSEDSLPTVTGAISLWLDGTFGVNRFETLLPPFASYFREREGNRYGRWPRARSSAEWPT